MAVGAWAKDYAEGMTGLRRFMTAKRPHICPFDLLIESLPTASKVLDIGCGSGLMLYMFWRAGRLQRGIGVDIDPSALACGRNALNGCAPLAPIELTEVHDPARWPRGPFDVVSMVDVLHHVPKRMAGTFIREATSRVSPGGQFIYKDMACRPLWAASWNRLHDLVMARQWIHYVPLDVVIDNARGFGLNLHAQRAKRLLAYQHDLLVFRRGEN